MRKMAKDTLIRKDIVDWFTKGVINYKQLRKMVKMVNWYDKEPMAVSTWQGTLFGVWPTILLGIEKDGEAHS